jgi:hypothetical protein
VPVIRAAVIARLFPVGIGILVVQTPRAVVTAAPAVPVGETEEAPGVIALGLPRSLPDVVPCGAFRGRE